MDAFELMNQSFTKIRQEMRDARRAQPTALQIQHAASNHALITQQPIFQNSQHIACYLPVGGEMATQSIIETILSTHKQCYLPCLPDTPGPLHFTAFTSTTPLKQNCYGILEPEDGHTIHAHQLDLVLVPLVAFDTQGHRLGMGKGYYDRTFAFLAKGHTKPILMGLAYEFQKVNALTPQPWDIPLNAVATESQVYYFDHPRTNTIST